jgi:hypothetical protein
MANLNRTAAKWSLFELDERHDALVEIDCTDRGNVATRLVHATNETAALDRFAESIARINAILPNCEVAVLSAAEIAFRGRGLEFARARMGAEERVLEERNWPFFLQLLAAIRGTRHPYGPRQHPLFRLRPERWLESLVAADVSVIDERLDRVCCIRRFRILCLGPRHARRVDHHPRRPPRGRRTQSRRRYPPPTARPGLLVKSGVASHPRRISSLRIFRGTRAIDRKATAVPGSARLHVHPATDILLRYISPEIEWEFVGIDERWREGVKVVFRKRPERSRHHGDADVQRTPESPLRIAI